MLIVSDFKDYYDYLAKLGVDKSLVFNRKSKEFKENDINDIVHRVSYYTIDDRQYYKDICIVVFCGKAYPIVVDRKENTCTRFEDFKFSAMKGSYKYYSVSKSKAIRKLIDLASKDLTDLCISNKSPILLFKGKSQGMKGKSQGMCDYYGETNPILRELGFQSIVDPYTAWQELQMFIGNFISPLEAKEIVELKDKDKIVSAGFDLKTSFRKC